MTAPAAPEGPGCAELYRSGLGPEGLGFALAWLARGVPRDLDALAAWLQQAASPAPVRVDPPEAAGFAGLTGPTPCRGLDPSRLRVEGDPPGLRSVRPTVLAGAKLAAARDHFAAGRFPEARADWQVAGGAESAPLPSAALAVAGSYAEEGRWQESLALYQEVAGRFPWNPEAHAGIGRSLRALARRIEAIEAWSRALALWPRSAQLRAQVAGDAFAEWHPPLGPPAARLERDGQVRWVQLAGPERDPASPHVVAEAEAYATCKEAFRSSAALRRAATGRDLPIWLWTPAEESVCTGAWLRIYLQNRGQGRGAEDGLETLVEIARDGYLDERALADVGAWVHEAAPLLLEAARRRRLFAFVEKYRVTPRRDAGWLFP